jgi:hypothetical protein
MLTGKRFRLERTTLALGQTNGKRQATPIPSEAILKVVSGPRDSDGLVDVVYDERVFEMFVEDLKARATELEDESVGA